jgi:hypothetical protein
MCTHMKVFLKHAKTCQTRLGFFLVDHFVNKSNMGIFQEIKLYAYLDK